MPRILTYLLAFLLSVLATSLVGSVFSTQFVIAGLREVGVVVPVATRLWMTMQDLAVLRTLLLAVAACFLIGFAVAGPLAARLPGSRTAWFVVAGAAALVTELQLMGAILGLMPIAGARTGFGLVSQAVAGGVGGWCFARTTPTVRRRRA